MLSDGLYKLFHNHFESAGAPASKSLVARFLVTNGNLVLLEDHGLISQDLSSGPITPAVERSLARMKTSGHYTLRSEEDISAGEHPDEIPSLDVGLVLPEASFWLQGGSFAKPVRLDIHGDTFIMDNTPLEHGQAQELEERIASGELRLTPISGGGDLAKSENGAAFQQSHRDFLQNLQHLKNSGILSPEQHDSLAQPVLANYSRYFADSMTPQFGNREAFDMFHKSHSNHGYHVAIDGNDFGLINKHLGFQEGDKAIKAYGKIFHDAMQKYEDAKGYRKGGDEFHFWFQHPEHAANFVRDVRQNMENSPRIGGVFNHAVGMGIGPGYDASEKSLEKAKWQMGPPEVTGKRRNMHAFGSAPTTIHNGLTNESYRTPDEMSHRNNPTEEFLSSKLPAFKSRQPEVAKMDRQDSGELMEKALPIAAPPVQQPTYTIPTHPAITKSHPQFAILSADKPHATPSTHGGNPSLEKEMQLRGLKYEPVKGMYGGPEDSYIVYGVPRKTAQDIGKRYGQQSVIHVENGNHKLIYTNHENPDFVGKYHPMSQASPVQVWQPHEEPEEKDFYTSLSPEQGGHKFRYNLDWDRLLPLED